MAATQPLNDLSTGLLWRGNALGLSSMLIWSLAFPAAEVLLKSWDPMTLTVARFAISILFLIPVWIMIDGWQAVRNAPHIGRNRLASAALIRLARLPAASALSPNRAITGR